MKETNTYTQHDPYLVRVVKKSPMQKPVVVREGNMLIISVKNVKWVRITPDNKGIRASIKLNRMGLRCDTIDVFIHWGAKTVNKTKDIYDYFSVYDYKNESALTAHVPKQVDVVYG